jgi:hypothetical protein
MLPEYLQEAPIIKHFVLLLFTGSQSIISQFFYGASLINDDSLDAKLDREQDKGLWEIKIKGIILKYDITVVNITYE